LTTINATDTGFYNALGDHDPGNKGYLAGEVSGSPYRDFFVFNIPVLSGTPLAAELRVKAYTGVSPDGTETYELRAVTTAIATLSAGGSGLTAIYTDLGDGTLYGGRNIAASETGFITIPLNASFLAALPSGGPIALGGQITTFALGGGSEYLFGFSLGNPGDVQLVLTLAPTHLPAFQLQVTYLSPNSLQVSWPVTPDGGQLQSSPSLSSPAWTAVPDAPAIVGGQNVVVLPTTGGQLFFRLAQTP
jgi:hypothetical protein